MDRDILRIALPSIVSNITVPLLGLVDLAIVGHLGSTSYIGAISLGGMVFNVMYWIFAFLRMGSSGMTAQSFGRCDHRGMTLTLWRSVLLGVFLSALLMLFQPIILRMSLLLMLPEAEIATFMSIYFHICIWGALPSLCLFSLTGWMIGMQDSRGPMWVAILQNVINIFSSLLFVYVLGMKVEGVALGTLTAQYAGCLIAAFIVWRSHGHRLCHVSCKEIISRDGMGRFFSVNRDIFFRTLCLVSVFLFFTSAGSWQGGMILASNTLLMQFYMLFSFIMDGFAFSGEALSGKYYGASDSNSLQVLTRRLFIWGAWMTLLFTLAYLLGGGIIIRLLTNEQDVIRFSGEYLPWVWLLPIASVAAFIWDGIFIGITASRHMFYSSAISAAVFFTVYFSLSPTFANHALWLAFIMYMVSRGLSQSVMYRVSLRHF